MDSKTKNREIIAVLTTNTVRGRKVNYTLEVDLSPWGDNSIFRRALIHAAEKWNLSPPNRARVDSLRIAVSHISPRTTTLMNSDMATMTRDDIRDLLQSLDMDFASPLIDTDEVANNLYFSIRKVISRTPGVLKDGFSPAEATAAYIFTSRHWRPKPSSPVLPPSISHIGHQNIQDLRRQVERVLAERKFSIEEAASNEIRRYEEVIAEQRALVVTSFPIPAVANALRDWITRSDDSKVLPRLGHTVHEFAAVVLKEIGDTPNNLDASGWPTHLRLPVARIDVANIAELETYRYKLSFWPWFYAQHRLPNAILTAIFLLLLSHTAWNIASVASLKIDDISSTPQGGYSLQGYKGKTDDETPKSDVPAHLTYVCKAIDLLLWNYQQLCELKLIDPTNERRLWFGWQQDNFQNILSVASVSRLDSISKRYGIDVIKPSELRPLKAALAYLPQRDLEAVRVLLGHADLRTSDAYLETTLFFRLNEAMILEFQRRVEASLTFAIGGEKALIRQSLSMNHVDSKLLLVPTGDGGVCTDIKNGPAAAASPPNQLCPGIACQYKGGCENHRLIVDETTLVIALRTRLYYRARWQTIYEKNPQAFSEFHLPKLLYTYVVLRIVCEQRPDLYAKAEDAINNEL